MSINTLENCEIDLNNFQEYDEYDYENDLNTNNDTVEKTQNTQ